MQQVQATVLSRLDDRPMFALLAASLRRRHCGMPILRRQQLPVVHGLVYGLSDMQGRIRDGGQQVLTGKLRDLICLVRQQQEADPHLVYAQNIGSRQLVSRPRHAL